MAEGRSSVESLATFKILLIGDSGTGKSSFLLRFTDDVWLQPDQMNATIGVDFKVKSLVVDEKRYKLTIWVRIVEKSLFWNIELSCCCCGFGTWKTIK